MNVTNDIFLGNGSVDEQEPYVISETEVKDFFKDYHVMRRNLAALICYVLVTAVLFVSVFYIGGILQSGANTVSKARAKNLEQIEYVYNETTSPEMMIGIVG